MKVLVVGTIWATVFLSLFFQPSDTNFHLAYAASGLILLPCAVFLDSRRPSKLLKISMVITVYAAGYVISEWVEAWCPSLVCGPLNYTPGIVSLFWIREDLEIPVVAAVSLFAWLMWGRSRRSFLVCLPAIVSAILSEYGPLVDYGSLNTFASQAIESNPLWGFMAAGRSGFIMGIGEGLVYLIGMLWLILVLTSSAAFHATSASNDKDTHTPQASHHLFFDRRTQNVRSSDT